MIVLRVVLRRSLSWKLSVLGDGDIKVTKCIALCHGVLGLVFFCDLNLQNDCARWVMGICQIARLYQYYRYWVKCGTKKSLP